MLRRKSGGNGLKVASGVTSTPAAATTSAPENGSANRKTSMASNIVTPSKNGLSDTLGTSKTNGHNTSDAGVTIQDPSVGDDITFPLTPTPTTETKISRRRSYTRRPPGSSTAFIDMDPAHFPAPPGSSPAPVGVGVVKRGIEESESAKISVDVDGDLAATPASVGEGSSVKAGVSTPFKSNSKLNAKMNGAVNGDSKINSKTNARNTVATNSITNAKPNARSLAKSITKPNSITTSGSRGGSGSGNNNKKRKASRLSSSSPSDSDEEEAMSSDAHSDSVSESESGSEPDTSGDDILTPSKSMFKVNGSGTNSNSGKDNCKGYGKRNEYTAATTPATSTVTATPRKPLPRRSKSSTPAGAYVDKDVGNGAGNGGYNGGDGEFGVLGDMNVVGGGVGDGVSGDVSDDEMDSGFDIDADVDIDVNADDEMDFGIDIDEKEWFGEMGFGAEGQGMGKASGDGKGKSGKGIGNGNGKGKGKRGWRQRVSEFEV